MTIQPHDELPALTAGLTHLEADDPRTGALHRLVLAAAEGASGPIYWIDTRSTASTYVLLDRVDHPRRLDDLHVARAFTAYQHHTLVHRVVDRLDDRTALVVVPCLDALYADDDVPTAQAELLLADVLDGLADVAADHDLPVLVTAGASTFADRVCDRADRRITARSTDLGTAFETDSFRTTVYRGAGFWQTTIPYWVDLLGRREASEPTVAAARPTLSALG